MEGDKGNVELKEFEKKKSILDQEKVLKVVKHEGLSKKDYGITSKESQVRRGKLVYKGKASKEFVDEIDANEGHISGKLMKQHQTSNIQQKLEDSNLGRSTKAWRVQKVSKALVPVQRQCHSIKLEGEIVSDASSWGMLRQNRTDNSQWDDKSINKSLKGEKIGFGIDRHDRCERKYLQVEEVANNGEIVSDASSWGMLRQKGTDNSQWDDESINNTLKGEKIGAGIDRHGRRERKYLQVEEVASDDFVHENGTLTRRGYSFSERIDGNGAEEERAAFKNFDEFSDVVDKPRVSRMEMEERIQKLAMQFIYTTALDVLGKVNRPVEALNSSHSMQQQVSTYPDLVAYQCIAVTLGKAGYLKELFDVIDSMRSPPKKKFKTEVIGKWDPELEPDIMVYAT
ncbi:pentatricopeptide repeat-containing protein [Quercus suber]|uniref:Pentatricopeptide repeat-containing protein n=1 Tax=Quercus suber TaxID=58331 RepID=A0AAW0IWW1_QUESU